MLYTDLVFIVGGYSSTRDVEVVDFGGIQLPSVPKPADLPVDMDGLVAELVGNRIVACGGTAVDRCYAFDFDQNAWKEIAYLDGPRFGAASFVYQGDSMYILGGMDPDGYLSSTSVILQDNDIVSGGSLPYPALYPCVATVNETHVFFAGGAIYGGYSSNAYLVEVAGWKWTKVADMTYQRGYHSCGRAGNNIVAVGGIPSSSTAEMFSLETLTWSAVPAVPTTNGNEYWGAPHVYQLDETFFLIGGYSDRTIYLIYEFDFENTSWKLRTEQLARGRGQHAIARVPSQLSWKLNRIG